MCACALRVNLLALMVVAAFSVALLAPNASAQTVIENFNDNVLSSADWTTYSSSPSVAVSETNSRLQFSTASNPLIDASAWNHAEISSTWGLGTKANIQLKMDVNFVPQVGATLSTANTGMMVLFSPVDYVASTNGIADGFGVIFGSELSSFNNYNHRVLSVIKVVNGQPFTLKSFYNAYGTDDFFDSVNPTVSRFTLSPSSTVYVSYLVATSTLQVSTAPYATPMVSAWVPNAALSTQRPLRLSLGGYAVGPTKPLVGTQAWIDNVTLQQGARVYRSTGLNATDGSSTTGIALTWNAAPSAVSYNIYRSVNSGLAYLIANSTTTSYTDAPSGTNSLIAGVNYTYVVRALSAAGNESESSNADVGWFNIGPATNLVATDGTLSTGVNLTWTAPTAPSASIGYKVMRATGTAAATQITLTRLTNYLDTSAVAGTLYTYSIIAVTGAGDSLTTSNTNTGWRFIAAPTVTSVVPNSGPIAGGTAITITGTNFTGASVTLGGVAPTSVVVVSPTQITAVTPTGQSSSINIVANLVVTTLGGTVTKTGAFTYAAAPTLTSVTPSAGPLAAGTTLTLTGTNFLAGATVKVGGVAATSVVVVSSTSITAVTPAGTAGAKDVAVTTVGGVATKTTAFTYVALPTITTVAPISGPVAGGTTITITGTNLTGATIVKVGGVAATIVTNTATVITATTPAGTAGAQSVAVTTIGGTATKASAFTYVALPTIASVSPISGPLTAGTSITIVGTNLTGATVTVGGVAATSVVPTATSITAKTPAGTAGAKDVVVTTAGGVVTKTGAFTYVALPTIASVSPTSGPLTAGTSITIAGTNFITGATVKVGGVAATSVVVVSSTSITAVTPAGTAGAKDVAVTTVGGVATKTTAFTYVALPTITTVAPISGPVAGGTTITITGTNLTGATIVKVGGVAATIVTNTATVITAKTPAGTAGLKSITVTTAGGTATKANAFTYVASFTSDETDSNNNTNDGGSVVAGKNNKSNDTSAGQSATHAATDDVAAAPMGVALYLQTVAQYGDSQTLCDELVTDGTNSAMSETTLNQTSDITVHTATQPIDLDHNGEADICQLRRGDLDLDGSITELDVAMLLDMVHSQPILGIGDLDGNGVIDSADISMMLLQMSEPVSL
ncbi:MAG: IPT/TIG domain-containing protein [Phycisphaerales bacterium]